MAKFIRNLMLALACLCMATPAAMADRHDGRGNRHQNNTSSQRPQGGHSGRPGLGGSNNRPGNNRPGNGGNNNGGHRPGNGGNNNGHRPGIGGGNNNNGHRPGNGGNNNNGHRPGNGGNNNNGHRPGIGGGNHGHRPGDNWGNNHRPGGNHRPGNNWNHRPGNNWNHAHNHHRPGMMPPPYRPYRPVIVRPHTRPVPPPMWRPRPGLPVLRSVLGLTFGSALSVSLDFLIGNGYTVDGYTNDIVYLRNVPALNYVWTDGALYYGASGLDGSSFYYSTPGRDITRYNSCYNVLVNTYGAPVSVVREGGGVVSTWFGGNNGYITLSFGVGQAGRFLTTLSYGL